MYERIFGKYPQVKAINYVLTNPERKYTKKEISLGAEISRVTLDSFISNLEEMKILLKDGNKYKLNFESKIVHTLIKTQEQLAKYSIDEELVDYDEMKDALSNHEFRDFLDVIDYDIDIDKEVNLIEENEKILISRKEYERLKSKDSKVITSKSPNTQFVINGYLNEDKNRRMINYG